MHLYFRHSSFIGGLLGFIGLGTLAWVGSKDVSASVDTHILHGMSEFSHHTAPSVDIYFSAGEVEGYGPGDASWDPSHYYGCNRHNLLNCSIHKMRVSLQTGEYTAPEVIVPKERTLTRTMGMVMPTVNADGTFLAYRAANVLDPSRSTRSVSVNIPDPFMNIHVRNLSTGADMVVSQEKSVRFPVWYNNNTLLYSRNSRNGSALLSVDIPNALRLGPISPATPVLGAGSGLHESIDFDDADVRQGWSPSDVHPPVVSFGMDHSLGETTPVPHVHGLMENSSHWQTESFKLGTARTSPKTPVTSCQHPTWSVDGQSIYCWNHSAFDRWPNARSLLEMTYRYIWSNAESAWVQSPETWAFTAPSPAVLSEMSSGLFPPGSPDVSPSCKIIAYKQASECGSSDYMITSLFCSDIKYNAAYPSFVSRVILVHREPFAYWDLTGLIEAQDGLPLGTIQGNYSTCHTVP